MKSHEDENALIDYIVGALGDDEAGVIKQRLLNDAEFSRDYERLLATFRPALQERDRESLQLEPPLHLAERTMAFIAQHAPAMCTVAVGEEVGFSGTSSDSGTLLHSVLPSDLESEAVPDEALRSTLSQRFQETQVHGARPVGAKMTEKPESAPKASRFSVLDCAVALGLLFCIGCFMVQAVAFSRHSARVHLCQNNLMNLGKALNTYALAHNGEYPSVAHVDEPELKVAGIYGPLLLDMDAQLVRHLFCPDVTPTRADSQVPKVPSFTELTAMTPEQRKKQQHLFGGDYAYNIGYVMDGKYVTPRMDIRTELPLLADRQWIDYEKHSVKVLAHGRFGYNALYKDGRVHFRAGQAHEHDMFFVNDDFKVALGDDVYDTVLGYSEAPVNYGEASVLSP